MTTFKPEFLNRIDDVVIFHRLAARTSRGSSTFRSTCSPRRVRERGIEVELTDDAGHCSGTSATTRPTAPGR